MPLATTASCFSLPNLEAAPLRLEGRNYLGNTRAVLVASSLVRYPELLRTAARRTLADLLLLDAARAPCSLRPAGADSTNRSRRSQSALTLPSNEKRARTDVHDYEESLCFDKQAPPGHVSFNRSADFPVRSN